MSNCSGTIRGSFVVWVAILAPFTKETRIAVLILTLPAFGPAAAGFNRASPDPPAFGEGEMEES